MNRKDFVNYLHDPSKMSKDKIDELERLVSAYPYFQSARVLLAKKKQEVDPKKGQKYVAKAAVYVTDRVLLKRYLSDKLFFLEPPPRPSERTVDKKKPVDPKLRQRPTSPAERPVRKPGKPITPEKETTENKLISETPPKSDLDLLIEEVYQDIENLKESKKRFQNWERKFEEEEAVKSAVQKATEPDHGDKEEVVQTSSTKEKEEPEDAGVQEGTSKTTTKEESDSKESEKESVDPVVAKEKVEEAKTDDDSSDHPTEDKAKSTSDVSKKPSETTKKSTRKSTSAKKTTSKKSTSSKTAKSTSTKSTTKKTTKTEDPKKAEKPTGEEKKTARTKKDDEDQVVSKRSRGDRQQDQPVDQKKIISDFIDKEPGITPAKKNKTTSENKDDLAETSTRFHADISSEYLAEIYIEQGKYKRAIEIYESLMLKFPEKESFFANRIEQLKKRF